MSRRARTAEVAGVVGQVRALVHDALGSAAYVLAHRELDARSRHDWECLRDVLRGIESDLAGYVEPGSRLVTLRDETDLSGVRTDKLTGPDEDGRGA